MTILQEEKFKRKDFEKTRDIVKVDLGSGYREIVESCKPRLQQTKDATTIRHLIVLGAKVVHDKKIAEIVDIIISNKRKNKRMGIVEFD